MELLSFLQHYWWAVVSLLGALLVFLLFVQGLQSLLLFSARTTADKDLVCQYAGHKWEITFTTLVTFGGAAFASFPLFYSTSFGGAYWAWIIILLLFVIQAISFEFRNAVGNIVGPRVFEIFLFLNGALGTFVLGVAVGTLFSGGAFVMEKTAITDIGNPAISYWANGWHGLDALANPFNLLLGLVLFFGARTLGLLYAISKPDSGELGNICRRKLLPSAVPFVLLFVVFVVWLFLRTGYRADAARQFAAVDYAYLKAMVENPWILALLLLGVVGVLIGLIMQILGKHQDKNFYIVGAGVVLAVWAILMSAGFSGNAYYISTVSPQMSLDLVNSSSSLFTLKVMAIVSLAVPFVVAYIGWAWRKMR
ncbi:MAG: cytochrome d ubiquinol oxidase subunit II [Bacteroidales bacterium]|nr:cytochrome d ubiquinol oxidase subunit II [Bacteroidales bacterium]